MKLGIYSSGRNKEESKVIMIDEMDVFKKRCIKLQLFIFSRCWKLRSVSGSNKIQLGRLKLKTSIHKRVNVHA